ncbi:MAG TPA: hypothetical protein PLY25_10180 [Bacteroidia bacterium]|nr:hypothetical protein [Bacteroidia bacterium]
MRTLTKQQFTQVAGKEYAPDSFFNPVLDADGDRVISEEEVKQTTNPDFEWVKDLPFKEFNPVVIKTL